MQNADLFISIQREINNFKEKVKNSDNQKKFILISDLMHKLTILLDYPEEPLNEKYKNKINFIYDLYAGYDGNIGVYGEFSQETLKSQQKLIDVIVDTKF